MAYTTIDDPTAYFQTKTYTGNGANNRAITFDGNSNLQPDWLWIKNRSESQSHALFDSVRGATLRFGTNSNGAESTENTNLDSFDSDGFTVDSELIVNGGSDLMVAWAWKAGTSFTNDASSTGIAGIDSAGSFNNTAGFSIVTYNGNAGNTTVKHGMNIAPKMVWFKRRDAGSTNWYIYHASIGQGKRLVLNTTAAEAADTEYMNNTAPTTSVFSLGPSGTTNTTGNHIAYCFSEIKGYSKIGSYTGNGNNDGPFVYTGFKPAFVLTKRTDASGGWGLNDNKRPNYNPENLYLLANDAQADSSDGSWTMDFLSNGWKARYNNGNFNASGGSYIYMAFAENPFVTATGVPTTAR